jgi:myosin-crossreactive antigen
MLFFNGTQTTPPWPPEAFLNTASNSIRKSLVTQRCKLHRYTNYSVVNDLYCATNFVEYLKTLFYGEIWHTAHVKCLAVSFTPL